MISILFLFVCVMVGALIGSRVGIVLTGGNFLPRLPSKKKPDYALIDQLEASELFGDDGEIQDTISELPGYRWTVKLIDYTSRGPGHHYFRIRLISDTKVTVAENVEVNDHSSTWNSGDYKYLYKPMSENEIDKALRKEMKKVVDNYLEKKNREDYLKRLENKYNGKQLEVTS